MATKSAPISTEKKRIANAKTVLRKIGLGSFLPKLSSNKSFWEILAYESFTWEIVRNHPDIPPHTLKAIDEEYRRLQAVPVIPILHWESNAMTAVSIKDYRDVLLNLSAGIQNGIPKTSAIRGTLWNTHLIIHSITSTFLHLSETMIKIIALQYSKIDGNGRVTFKYDQTGKCRDGQLMRQRMFIGLHRYPSRQCIIDGKPRSVFKAQYIIKRCEIIDEVLIVHHGKTVPLYIQSHAIRRIEERFDICNSTLACEVIYQAVENKETIQYKGKILLPVNHNECRIGYLLCTPVEEIMVISTFLLVTHCGTPEGDCFMTENNLVRDNIKYLQIERLSQFFEKNIQGNAIVKDLFQTCGLSYMLNLSLKKILLPETDADDFMSQILVKLLSVNGLSNKIVSESKEHLNLLFFNNKDGYSSETSANFEDDDDEW